MRTTGSRYGVWRWSLVKLRRTTSMITTNVFVYTTPSRISGAQGEVREYEEGYVQYTEVGGGIQHSITNVSDVRHHQIIVEMKGGSVSASPQPPENNGRSRSPG